MHHDIAQLLQQAEQLRDGLKAAHDQARRLNYDSAAIEECLASIRKCVKMVGNNRVAALSSKDQRKVMAELEDSVERLVGYIS